MSDHSSVPVSLRLSIMMLLQFFVWGAWYVTAGAYFTAEGLDSVIAWVYTVGPVAAIVSPFFLGMIADRFFASERVLAALHIIGGVVIALAPIVYTATNDPGVIDALRAAAAVHLPDAAPEVIEAARIEAALRSLPADAAESVRTALAAGKLPAATWWPFVAMLLVHMLCYMPTLGLTNTVAFHAMTAPEKQFPLVRVWGTLGWIVAGFTISWLGVDKRDRIFELLGGVPFGQFQLAGAAAILLGLYSLTLPHTPPPARGKPFSARDALGLDALGLLRRPDFAIFVVASLLVCIPLAAYYAFGGAFVSSQGVERVGAVMSRGQMSEIFFMLVMPLFFVRLGVKWMLAVGMLAWVVRYALFAWAAGLDPAAHPAWLTFIVGDPHLTMPIFFGILLHGICYDFFFVTGFIYTEQVAPKVLRASAQGFLVLVTQGVGMLLGAQLSGLLHAQTTSAGGVTDWRMMWTVPAVMAFVVLVFFVLLFRQRPTPTEAADGSRIA